MKVYASTYTYTWTEVTETETIKIRSKQREYPITTTQRISETTTAFDGRFEVEIDLEAIATLMCQRASRAKTGRCNLLAGLAKVRRISKKPGPSITKPFPVDETKWERLAGEPEVWKR